MDNNFCFSEKNIIDKAMMHMKTNTATNEEKLLVKLYKNSRLEKSLDKIYDEIQPLNVKDTNIKNAFIDLENAFRKTFNTIYHNCGNCSEYAIDILIEYLEDVLIGKCSDKKENPSKTFILLDVIRDEMEKDKWYSINDMIDIIKNEYSQYDNILNKNSLNLLINMCVQEGYFEVMEDSKKPRYFKKTEKKYLDFEE